METINNLMHLNAADLRAFKPIGNRPDLPAVHAPQQSYWDSQRVLVIHRGLEYIVGHWGTWEGEFYCSEVRTTILYKGSLKDIKEWIRLCSAEFLERS